MTLSRRLAPLVFALAIAGIPAIAATALLREAPTLSKDR